MEKIFEYNEQIIMIETEEQLHELTAKMKKLERFVPCVINDVAVVGIDKEKELFLEEQCNNIAVNLHGSPLKVGSIDPDIPENHKCIEEDGMFLAFPWNESYKILPLMSVGYPSILKRLEMDCGAMTRFSVKADKLPLPADEKGQMLTRIAQLNSKLCYVVTLDGKVPSVVSDQYVQLPYDDLIHTMTDVLTKEHPDIKFQDGTLTYEYLVANYQLNDTMMEESLRLTLESAGRKVDSLSAGITFSSSDLGLSSVFLTLYLNLNGIRISLGDGIRMEHKGEEASMENFQKKCKELGRVLQENEERIEELGLMKVTDVPGVVKAVASKSPFLPKAATDRVISDLVAAGVDSGTGIDVYLALYEIVQIHMNTQKVSDERFLAMTEGVAKLMFTDFSKVQPEEV